MILIYSFSLQAIESGPSRSIPVMKTNQPAIKQNKEAGSGDNEKTES